MRAGRQPMNYAIFSAFSEEANAGWIWIGKKEFDSRDIVTISHTHKGRKLKVFCVVRKIESNFLRRYNEGACASTVSDSHFEGQRWTIEDEGTASLVMNEWYRRHCLGIPRHRKGVHPSDKREMVQLDIAKAEWNFSPFTWFPGVRAACHQPDIAIRL